MYVNRGCFHVGGRCSVRVQPQSGNDRNHRLQPVWFPIANAPCRTSVHDMITRLLRSADEQKVCKSLCCSTIERHGCEMSVHSLS
ncbi:hypothetical protein Rcae01_01039 [Novipirellula caenicola]|uniref:Uncharacterized protein n=1 Tax=Novipirellula caenicola TaxID=1536901 RepID=A0ABP9VK67_9BACT